MMLINNHQGVVVRVLIVLWGLLGLTACAPVQQATKSGDARPLVYPAPPDEPRYAFERIIMSSADVVSQKEDAALKRLLTGSAEAGEGMSKPYAIAVHKGRVFVSDSADRLVKVFDFPGKRFYKIGDDENGSLMKPLGLDVDQSGTVYVADATAKAIMVYSEEGKFLRKIGGPKVFDRLSSVSVDGTGVRLYVVDIGGVSSEHHRVRVFDAQNGDHLFDIGKRGSGPGEFNLPRDLAIGKEGRLYVTDGGNFRVSVFDAQGKFLKNFGSVGKQPGNFARPKEIATDNDGNVLVADTAFGNFQIFSPEGELLMFIGDRSEKGGPAQYMLPSGITVDEDGRIYMVDQWFKKIDVFRPYGLKEDEGFLGLKSKIGVAP
ncbi:6-bladed beta-propeller [Denitratisoma oestradiolicum]|uniref:6-bladed beta-propeller n=1 Tax=Denitratisoma oestradiolicum TaxID=311182 RepID=A0A6S6XXX3_9PROT|nr:6-bladed beta-propeller [Denitratisoma oestradiolicum]TWO80629.1 6-bladed beta-propeller [Denitratisoma oestradiolicum]CAB1367709.1 6-bladed beta-propeller [Denitratisoma oestradiolicum]